MPPRNPRTPTPEGPAPFSNRRIRPIFTLPLTAYVQSRPTGKYARRLWYLYELITGVHLPVADLARGTYVDMLDEESYYTVRPARQVRRQRVNDNLFGDARFCPTVRRTDTLPVRESA